jgi:hypothetical protein
MGTRRGWQPDEKEVQAAAVEQLALGLEVPGADPRVMMQ